MATPKTGRISFKFRAVKITVGCQLHNDVWAVTPCTHAGPDRYAVTHLPTGFRVTSPLNAHNAETAFYVICNTNIRHRSVKRASAAVKKLVYPKMLDRGFADAPLHRVN